MKITDRGWSWKSLTTSTVGYPSDSWASCFLPHVRKCEEQSAISLVATTTLYVTYHQLKQASPKQTLQCTMTFAFNCAIEQAKLLTEILLKPGTSWYNSWIQRWFDEIQTRASWLCTQADCEHTVQSTTDRLRPSTEQNTATATEQRLRWTLQARRKAVIVLRRDPLYVITPDHHHHHHHHHQWRI